MSVELALEVERGVVLTMAKTGQSPGAGAGERAGGGVQHEVRPRGGGRGTRRGTEGDLGLRGLVATAGGSLEGGGWLGGEREMDVSHVGGAGVLSTGRGPLC